MASYRRSRGRPKKYKNREHVYTDVELCRQKRLVKSCKQCCRYVLGICEDYKNEYDYLDIEDLNVLEE